jgi:hypothetical protein
VDRRTFLNSIGGAGIVVSGVSGRVAAGPTDPKFQHLVNDFKRKKSTGKKEKEAGSGLSRNRKLSKIGGDFLRDPDDSEKSEVPGIDDTETVLYDLIEFADGDTAKYIVYRNDDSKSRVRFDGTEYTVDHDAVEKDIEKKKRKTSKRRERESLPEKNRLSSRSIPA